MATDFLNRAKIAASAVVGAAAIAGGVWHSQSSSKVQLKPDTTKTTTTGSTTGDVQLQPDGALPPRSVEVADAAESVPVTRASSGDLPEPSAPPLEDVIEHAMPAIVMIETQTSRGSGFFVRPNLVVTNNHVVSGFTSVSVTTQNGTKLTGRVTQRSDAVDVALIEIGRPGPVDLSLPLGESASLRLGQGVVSLGWAQSLEQRTVTRGIVTGLRRVLDRPFLQIDAAPHPGDSGGPVMNRAGQVVGITTLRADDGSAGYAVPIDDAKPLLTAAQHVIAPPSTGPGAAVAARPSERDTQRAAGTERLLSVLGAAAQRAADLDAAWNRYKTACRITEVPAGLTHEWFSLYDPQSPLHRTAPRCANQLAAVQGEADALNTTMLVAEELARRADVFPGTRRDLRKRFRLDYAAWDR